ncbi:MAG: recombinase family protein [Cellulosilyticum sp.]|nr:recombinase family protein [Cellulosilyticum sp.]
MKVTILQPMVKPIVKKKVCAYARVSTSSNSQEESLENQTTYYRNKIEANPDYEFVGIFADSGYTGTKDNRPGFQQMMTYCREGKIDLILTKSISRFARNTTIVLEYVRELKLLDIEIHFERENIQTLSKDGELMLAVLSSFAEEESRSASENVKWRFRKKFEQGELLINTKRFLGYDKDEYGDLVINRKEAKIVGYIFEAYLSGKGTHKIAKDLNKNKIPTVTGTKWYDTTVLAILKNEKYKGDAWLQKTYTPNHLTKKKKRNTGEVDYYYIEDNHSAIISSEMWEAAQIKLKENRRNREHSQARNKYSGLLVCSKCGCNLRKRVWNSGKPCQKVVWQCSNYIKNGKDACSGTSVSEEELNKFDIKEETVVEECVINGEKNYIYSRKAK